MMNHLQSVPSSFGGASPNVRIIELIEDDASMQRALSMALRDQGYVVEVYPSRQAYVDAPRGKGARVVLLDMRLPDCSGLEIRDWLLKRQDATPVIFISGQSTQQEIIDAFKGGACDFLLKPISLTRLLESVGLAFERQQSIGVHSGRIYRLRAGWEKLTRREREVCVLMLQGMPNREIAKLHGSVAGTVKLHRGRVLAKMGALSLSELFELTAGEDLMAWLEREREDL
jgi:FixJ family two-component response regulator